MKLFEHEGKKLFEEVGIVVPKSVLVEKDGIMDHGSWIIDSGLEFPVVVKAQVLSGKRGKRGLVRVVKSRGEMVKVASEMWGKEIDGEVVSSVLVEEAAEIEREMYLAITYSTKSRSPVVLFSEKGGVEIEEMGKVKEVAVKITSNKLEIANKFRIQNSEIRIQLDKLVNNLWELFRERDLFLAEINPLVVTKGGELVALDAKVVTDDAADFRQEWELPERNMLGKKKSWAEVEAEKIDKEDHRGVVGRVYLDLPGDIGVIAAGGGASLVAMDALVGCGLSPANYTEFSGNPPERKVKRLSEIVMAKKNLRGVILVGGKANFTDQVETLSGFAKVIREMKPDYPIVVRRDGPRMDEAKKMLEDLGKKLKLNLVVYDSKVPIVEAVGKLEEMVSRD